MAERARWRRVRDPLGGTEYRLELGGETLADASRTGSRLETDRWRWSAGDERGTSATLSGAKEQAETAGRRIR